MIESTGLRSNKDIEIEIIGLRPGEKLHEELYWQGEAIVPTNNKKITMLKTNGFDKDAYRYQLHRLKSYEKYRDRHGIFEVLKDLVQEGDFGDHLPVAEPGVNGFKAMSVVSA